MTSIPFTQYTWPNGEPRQIFVGRPPEVMNKAFAIIAAGFRFETELLTTGEVSLTLHDPETEEDVDIEVVPNGPEVPAAVDRLVERNAHRART